MPDDPDISRRSLLRGKFLGRVAAVAANAMAAGVEAFEAVVAKDAAAAPSAGPGITGRRFVLPIHRPPGAVDELSFLSGCTRCNECVKACPVSAIVHAPARFREAAGTPMIDPHTSACVMCEDTPCITSCKPGVLRADQPKKRGVAWIQTMACLAHTGSFCTVCSERCPVPGAIEVAMGKPRILENECTGCGVCAAVCPAPVNAIVVMPLADRVMTDRTAPSQ